MNPAKDSNKSRLYPTLEERKQFALRIHASYAFSTVVDICEYILNTPITENSPAYNPMVIAIYTTYGRPFTNSWGFGKMKTDLIPEADLPVHKHIMDIRDKLYAHSDKNMTHELYGPMNDIRININREGRVKVWTQPVQASSEQLKQILGLAKIMHKKMEYWTDRFLAKHVKQINEIEHPPGDYLLDTENECGLFLARAREDADRERQLTERALKQLRKKHHQPPKI